MIRCHSIGIMSDETQNAFSERVPDLRQRVEAQMASFVTARLHDDSLGEAVRYALATEGKRIRPLLVYATADLLGVNLEVADHPAAAIELIHTYSLVHDDLPAMDNDDLRRGRLTVHKVFDEATGILVGDALLTYAFELLSSAPIDSELALSWVNQLSQACGAQGMIAGQATDIEGESRALSLSELETMHRRKSGALIEASLQMIVSAANGHDGRRLGEFGHHIGLAFQVRDDLLDIEASTEELGKPQGSDKNNNKSTFVSLLGMKAARERMHQEYELAMAALDGYGQEADGLRWLADMIIERTY